MINQRTRKIHILFSLGFLVMLAIGVAPRLASGESFFRALWAALTDVRPVEWVMLIAFWYALAKNNLKKTWFDPPTTLGLADRNGG